MSSKTLAVLVMAFLFHVSVGAVENGTALPGNGLPAESVLPLTPEERLWLETHKTIRIAFDGSLPPYSFVNDEGETDGIALEIMRVLSRRLGIEFSIYPKSDWTAIYKAAAKRKVDIVATMVKRPDRAEWFAFTKPYITKSLVIVTQAGDAAIRSRDDLRAKKVAVVKGYQYAEQIGNEFPSAQRIYVDTMLDSLRQVVAGQADAAILFLGTANYLQSKYKLDNLKVAAFYDRNSANESIAVRKDWPILLAILQKGLDSLTEEEVQHIFAKWISGDPKSAPEKSAQAAVPEIKMPSETPTSDISGARGEDPKVDEEAEQPSAVSGKSEKTAGVPVAGRHERITTLIILSLIVLALFVAWWSLIRKQKKPMHAVQNGESPALRELQSHCGEVKQTRIEPTLETADEPIIEQIRETVLAPQNEFIYYQHDCSGHFSYVSDSVTRLLGYTESEFMEHYRDYLTDNPINREMDAYTDNCIRGFPNRPYEIEIYDTKGLKRRLEVIDTPVYDGQGHCIGVDGVMHEIVALVAVDIKPEEETDVVIPIDNAFEIPTPDRQSPLLTQVKGAIQTAHQTQKSFVLMYVSLDRLRMLDGSALNFAPDEVLEEAAKRLYSTLRSTDTVIELGSNQFALILPDTETGALSLMLDKIRKILQIPYLVGVSSIVLDANIGSAVYPNSHQDPESLIEEAKVRFSNESAMFKQEISDSADLLEDESLQIQQDLVAALDECKVTLRAKNTLNINALSRLSQFAVYYQSRHHAGTFDIAGFEALIRWHHPKLGMLLPKDFIELVKEVGMLDVLTYWIIQQVSFQAVAWDKAGVRPKFMAVNLEDLSGKHAVDVAKIVEIIMETGAKPEWLEFSIAERELAENPETLVPIVNQFVAAGLAVAIDNFGTDSAILAQLKAIPAHVVEIDPEFIRSLPGNQEDADIVSYTVGMLHGLGKTVIAKEVETEEQLACLKSSGCDIVQGHLLSKPLPAKEARTLIETLPDLVWYLRQK